MILSSDDKFDLDQWYKNNYNQINATAVPNSLSNRILHKIIEKPFKSNANLSILEVGANKGEHLPYVAADFTTYTMTDIRPLPKDGTIDEIRTNSKAEGVINFQIADVQALPFEDQMFDRVISTCLFHHLDKPVEAFQELRRVTKIGGKISILIPNDPGILYRTLRGVTTLLRAKKLGLYREAQLFHAIEHRNHFLQLSVLLENEFKDAKISYSYFPTKVKSYNFNALTVFHVALI
jgi:phosphatidylethanolamine/phosphatidyl-N-methylethanolamine N-methyltransferase